MKKITFLYYGPTCFASWIICARLSSLFSHCAVVFEDDVYQANMLKGVNKTKGLKYSNHTVKQTITVSEEKYTEAKALAESLVGVKYDFKAIMGFILGIKYQTEGNWFCSEYGRVIFEAATGIKVPLFNLLTPGQLRLIIETFLLTSKADK